jgi:carbon starvation protein
MSSTILVLIGLAIYLIMYFAYGKNLQNNIVKADKQAAPPSKRLSDGVDFVPTNKWVLFGHHFASIAGAGPIVGPTIAMAWGWIPALIWIWVGNIFIGAVHDYLALMASVRHDGKSIQWVAGKLMKKRTGYVFEWFVLLALVLIIAAFGATVGAQFNADPRVPAASVFTTIAAIILGVLLYKTKLNFNLSTGIGIVMLIMALWLGGRYPLVLVKPSYQISATSIANLTKEKVAEDVVKKIEGIKGQTFKTEADFLSAVEKATSKEQADQYKASLVKNTITKQANYRAWLIVLGFYCIIASAIPVWILLQPRDYLNSFLLVAGIFLGGLAFLIGNIKLAMPGFAMWSAPVIEGQPAPFWPVVPLIIACGSLSGFHALVASGTSSKQLDSETSGLLIGYGAMFTEGFLSTIVVCSVGGFGFAVLGEKAAALQESAKAFGNGYFAAMTSIGGPAVMFSKAYGIGVNAVLKLPTAAMTMLAGIWVSAFALTTLDTTNRIARYTVTELAEPLKEKASWLYALLSNRWIASLLPCFVGLWLAWTGQYGLLWPAFSGANQMLASIALLTGSIWVAKYLRTSKGYQLVVTIPALILWFTVLCALIWYLLFAVPVFKLVAVKWIVGGMTVVMIALNIMLLFDYFSAKKEPLPEGEKDMA